MTSTRRHRQEMSSMTRKLFTMIVVLLAVVASVALTGSSSASFVSSSSSTGTVAGAADWVAPTVSVTQPSSVVKGAITIAATATDAGTGVASVAIQGAPAGNPTWTTICTDTTLPYSCDFATTSAPDGSYNVRAVAVDNAGNTTTSAIVSTIVANTLTVTLSSPAAGSVLTGAVTTTSTVSNAGTVAPSVRVDYAPTGTTSWTPLCTAPAAPYTCSDTIASGTYDLRSVATAGSATYTSAVVAGVIVDNSAPVVTMTDPGTPLKGTKTFAATATDAHSGVAKVVIQGTTGTTWADICTISSAPFTCSVDTATLANGTYSFRAVATDNVGLSTTSTAVTGRIVSNFVSSVTMAPVNTRLKGAVSLTATATSTGTIASVKFQRSVAGTNNWVDICTDTTSPYGCSFATTAVADGTYDLRAVVTDPDGVQTASAVITNRIIDNVPPKGVDIQTTNGGTAGRIDTDDTIVYTFSEQMDLSSIYSGWSGTATAGTVRIPSFFSQSFDISSPSTFRLGAVDLNATFGLFAEQSTDAVITASTVTADGVERTVITVKIVGSMGYQISTRATMVWTPSSAITDLAGNAIVTTPVTESGTQDVDF